MYTILLSVLTWRGPTQESFMVQSDYAAEIMIYFNHYTDPIEKVNHVARAKGTAQTLAVLCVLIGYCINWKIEA
jgi:hypothetical protein